MDKVLRICVQLCLLNQVPELITVSALRILCSFQLARNHVVFALLYLLLLHKHLGLIIDENLTWTSHIQAVYSATAQRLGMLARLEKRLVQESLRKIFDGFVRPRLEYACTLWCGGNYQKLVRLQDKFCRRHQIRLPPLKARFEYHTAVLFFKMKSTLSC